MANHAMVNKRFASQPAPAINWTVFQTTSVPDGEAIRCLIDALTTADKAIALEIEHQLVKAGQTALPMVLKGLISQNAIQQATCAMVLLRWQAVQPLHQWVEQNPDYDWIAHTLLDMMSTVKPIMTVKPALTVV